MKTILARISDSINASIIPKIFAQRINSDITIIKQTITKYQFLDAKKSVNPSFLGIGSIEKNINTRFILISSITNILFVAKNIGASINIIIR